ncbi:FixH family protein [candidate division TA06 bacterium]|nr:FixH family protein [candidate division TA06 bacterium]
MFYIKSLLVLALLSLAAAPALAQHDCANCPSAKAAANGGIQANAAEPSAVKAPVYNQLPGYGKKAWIGQDFYFTYNFDKKPKMGPAVLKVQLFSKDGKKAPGWEILGRSGMPSMSGAHDAEAVFKLNKKGDYLLPVTFVMPGEWEIKLTFKKDGNVVYLGNFKLNV